MADIYTNMSNEGQNSSLSSQFEEIARSGREKREREAEELAQAFVQGGMWLARQNDPVMQFELIAAAALIRNAFKRAEAQKQFEEIVESGDIDVGRAFDAIAALVVAKINPGQFLRVILDAQSEKEGKAREKRIESFFKSAIEPVFIKEQIISRSILSSEFKNSDFNKNPFRFYEFKTFDKSILPILPKNSIKREFRPEELECIKRLYNRPLDNFRNDEQKSGFTSLTGPQTPPTV